MAFPTPSRSDSPRPAFRARRGPPSGAAFDRFAVPNFDRANFFAVSRRIGCGTTSSTKPARFARFASSVLPPRMTSSAAGSPAMRGSREQPPHAGRMPSLISGKPIWVFFESDASRQSIASAVSHPPPTQAPSMAATVGYGRFASFPKTRWPNRTPSATRAGSAVAISVTSAPAMKMSGFEETRTSAFKSVRFARSSRKPSSSLMTEAEYLFTFSPGVSKKTMPSPSGSTARRNEGPAACGAAASFSSRTVDITRPPAGSRLPARRRRRAWRAPGRPCGAASRGAASG